jgi:hypothetical protein
MKFLMLVSLDPSHDPGDTDDSGTLEVDDWVTKYDGAGVRLMGRSGWPRTPPASPAARARCW